MNYFYIICRDNSIHEVQYSKELYMKSLDQWSKGGILLVPSRNSEAPIGINCADVKNVFAAEDYKNWYMSVKPKQYIKAGTWFDGKEGSFVRNEPWKIQQKAKLLKKATEAPQEQIPAEKLEEIRNDLKKIFPKHNWK